jgi:hypothetical protein
LAACAAVVALLPSRPLRAAADAAKRTVFVSVVNDKDHVPVTDIQASDLEVKEGGKTMEIVSVKRATTPMRIAVVDSDGGYGSYQQGLLQFMQKLLDHAEFSITSVVVQPIKLVDYTSDVAALSKALDGLGRRGPSRGGQLMEAIYDAAKTVRAEGKRAVILALRVGGEGTSSTDPKRVRDQIYQSGATLIAVTVKGMDTQAPVANTAGAPKDMYGATDALRNEELTTGQQNLQLVLGDGSRESGGHYDEIVAVSLVKGVELIADQLLDSYEVVYAVPDGTKPSDKLQVSTKRKNVTVWAPNHPPM